MTREQAIAEKLLQVDAIRLSPENPFTWASGWKSPIYCDNRKVLSFPTERDFIKSELCGLIFEEFPEVDALAGVATAGIAWGAMAADQLKLPFLYVRPKPKDHGLGNQIEGTLRPGSRVLVVEDLVSTGKSSMQVCDVLRAAGVEIAGMVCLFSYGFPEADMLFAENRVRLVSLSRYTDLIDLAVRSGKVGTADKQSLDEWRQRPSTWQARQG